MLAEGTAFVGVCIWMMRVGVRVKMVMTMSMTITISTMLIGVSICSGLGHRAIMHRRTSLL